MGTAKSTFTAVGDLVRVMCLITLKVAAKQAVLFGGIGSLFLLVLFHQHPELSDDTMAISVFVVLASFWFWSLLLIWLIHSSPTYRETKPIEKYTLGKVGVYVAVLVFLYLGPSLLAAGFFMKLMHLPESSHAAFAMFNIVAQTAGLFCALGIAVALAKGRESLQVERSAVERVGLSSLSQQVSSFSGFLSHSVHL